MRSIADCLAITQRGIISFVGGGGKTTLMFRIADELAGTDGRTLVTTTTKIWPPDRVNRGKIILTQSKKELLEKADNAFRKEKYVIAASRYCSETDKLIGLSPTSLDALWTSGQFHWILVEADGAACRPIKAPADHEPVIPQETRYLIGLIGLSVLGRPLNKKNVHRVNFFQKITGRAIGSKVDTETIAKLIRHSKGLFKDCPNQAKTIAFLNQADLLENLETGNVITRKVRQNLSDRPSMIALGQAKKTPIILKTYLNTSINE